MCECGCDVATIESLFDQKNEPHPRGSAFSLTRRKGFEKWTHEHEGCQLVHAGVMCSEIRGLFDKEES